MFIRVLGLVIAVLSALVPTGPAAAHGPAAGTSVQFAQTIAGVELTVVVRPVLAVPAPLRVDLVAYRPVRELAVDVAVRSAGKGDAATGRILFATDRPGTYPVTLRVAEAGAHELELRAAGEASVLPFRVLVPRAAAWETLSYGGFALAGLLLAAALAAAVPARRRTAGARARRRTTGAWARRRVAAALGGVSAVALVVAGTVAVLSVWLPPSTAEGAPPAGGRPYAQAEVSTAPERPAVGQEFTLRLRLFDGSTGRPVDDLVAHHAALAHAVVTSADAAFFRHVHPIRTGAGTLEVRLRSTSPGRHLVHLEIERTDSGGQLLSGAFDVAAGGRASREGGVAPVDLPPVPSARQPTTIEYDAGAADLQSWLGMAGHLVVRSADGDFLGHVHEAGGMSTGDDGTVARNGPRLRFTFSFPAPGRYVGWIQYVRGFQVRTVPFRVEVGSGERP